MPLLVGPVGGAECADDVVGLPTGASRERTRNGKTRRALARALRDGALQTGGESGHGDPTWTLELAFRFSTSFRRMPGCQ